MKPKIKLPQQWMVRSLAFAERSVLGYGRGDKEASRAYARPGIDKSVDAQMIGKAGECAFCLYVGLDPQALDWTPKLDVGWDVVMHGVKVDVKTTDTEYLMWPVTKNHFLAECEADLFVMVQRLERPPRGATGMALLPYDTFEIGGWVKVSDFIATHHVAPPPLFLDPRTKYLHKDELAIFTEANRAGHRAGFVGHDAAGRFVHYCRCGKFGPYGYGVFPKDGKLGTWYCKEHRPT